MAKRPPPPEESWSKQRRFKHAIEAVLDHGWTQKEAAEFYGVSRQHLNGKVKAARQKREEEVARAKAKALGIEPTDDGGIQITADEDEFIDFVSFWRRYFGNWLCPDCGVHHDLPDFHVEIIDVLESGARRVVINIPPYHSKSTLVTVWWVVYQICKNRNIRIAIVSKSLDLGKAFLYQIKRILVDRDLYEGAEGNLVDDFGPFWDPDSQQVWNQTEIYVLGRTGGEKDPTVRVLGVGAQIYGARFDIIICDDIATLENQRNPDRVLGMLEWLDKEVASRIGKTGRLIWIGTRVHAGDIYSTLQQRTGYKVIRKSALLDDETEQVLWPEHFPYEQVLIHRSEMKPADFQLVYQNVDVPGAGASFPPELVDLVKDPTRVLGHYETGWRLVGGVDPAGASKASGFTALTVLAVDLNTGKRFIVDQYAERMMKGPDMVALMLQWSVQYPIVEWRVEANGYQSQILQYNVELVQELARRGIRVQAHVTKGTGGVSHTSANKWDPQFGVESIAPLFHAELYSIPWGNAPTIQKMRPLVEELIAFPMGLLQDRVMSLWFAELAVRDLMRRQHLPLFNERMKVPGYVKRRRKVIDFEAQEIRPVLLKDQYPGHMSRGLAGYRRLTVGHPTPHPEVVERPPPVQPKPFNIDPDIWPD